MELVKTTTVLLFSQALNPWRELRNILRDVGESQKIELEGPPIVIDIKDKKQRVLFHFKAIELTQEGIDSVEDSIDLVINKLKILNNASKLPRIKKISYESIFIEPYAVPFHELLILMKHRFLQPSPFVDSTTDFGLVFDQIEGDVFKHCQTGPMGKDQLLNKYLHFGRDQVPDNFVFLSLQHQQSEDVAFNTDYVRKSLQTAGQWQICQAKSVFGYLKGGGD